VPPLRIPSDPGDKHVFYRQLRKFTIESDQPLHCNLDGEPIHASKLEFGLLRNRLRIAY
jgi:diacylglycerol kinase family enzyme